MMYIPNHQHTLIWDWMDLCFEAHSGFPTIQIDFVEFCAFGGPYEVKPESRVN